MNERIRKQSAKKYVWHICDRIFHFKKYCQSIVKDDVKFVNRRFSFSCFVLFTWSLDIGENKRTLKSPWRENFLFCFATWLKGFGSRTEGEWPLVMIEDFPQLYSAARAILFTTWNQGKTIGSTYYAMLCSARQNVVFNNNNICNNYERASLLAFHLLKFHQFSKWPTRRSLRSSFNRSCRQSHQIAFTAQITRVFASTIPIVISKNQCIDLKSMNQFSYRRLHI